MFNSIGFNTNNFNQPPLVLNISNTVPFRYQAQLPVKNTVPFRYQAQLPVQNTVPFRYRADEEVRSARPFRYSTKTGVRSIVSFRYEARQAIFASDLFRYQALTGVEIRPKFRYSNITVEGRVTFHYSIENPIESTRAFRYSARSAGYDQAWQCSCTEDFSASYAVLFNDVSTPIPKVHVLSISMGESRPTTWSLNLLDEDGTLIPDNACGVPFANLLNQDAYGPPTLIHIPGAHDPPVQPPYVVYDDVFFDQSYNKLFIAKIHEGGHELDFSGVPTQYAWSEVENKFSFTWSGIDTSHALFRDAQNMATVQSTVRPLSLQYAKGVAQEILRTYHIPGDLALMDDFIVPIFHRQNSKPIDWLRKLFEVTLDEWFVKNGVFTVYFPQQLAKEQAQWVYDDKVVCIQEHSNASGNAQLVNQVVAVQARESGNTSAVITCTKWGQYTATFPQPLSNVQWQTIVANFGDFSNFVFRNHEGHVVAVRNLKAGDQNFADFLKVAGIYNVTSCDFTWGQPFGFVQTVPFTPYGQIRFFGTPLANTTYFGNPAESQTAVVSNVPSITTKGLFKRELSPNPLIADYATLLQLANRYLIRFGRMTRIITLRVPLNIDIFPSQTIRYKNFKLCMDVALYVTGVDHVISDVADSRYTTLTCVQYLS